MPLLADRRVEQNYCTADEVDELFIDVVGSCLVLVALVARALGSQLTNCVLKRSPHVRSTYPVYPFKFNFEVIRLAHIVVNCLVLKSVGYYRLKCRKQPRSEVQSSPV